MKPPPKATSNAVTVILTAAGSPDLSLSGCSTSLGGMGTVLEKTAGTARKDMHSIIKIIPPRLYPPE